MHLEKITVRDYLVGFAFVLLMVGIATWLHDYEIILPEIAALTSGMWIYKKSDWLNQPLKIFQAPSGTAVIGFVVNRLPLNYPEKVVVTLLLILLLLRGLRSTLAPSFATGLLPIIVNATHWSFIIAIFAFTLTLMGVVLYRGLHHGLPANVTLSTHQMLIFLVAGILWTGLVWSTGNPQMAAIPPVLVVFFEALQQPSYSGKMALKHIIALSSAATIGVLIHLVIASWLLTTLISLPLIFILLAVLQLKLPAAYAFPLLALVLPTPMFDHLPLAALLAASFFMGTVFIVKQITNRIHVITEDD